LNGRTTNFLDDLTRLSDLRAIEFESRPRSDDRTTYAVIVVNWMHPLIMHMNVG
jgi:hypothetical protein